MDRQTHHCSTLKRWLSYTLSAVLTLQPPLAYGNPQGGSVSAGSATITSSGNTLTVNQQSNRAVINWTGFDIATGETTQFVQPASSSIALNRVFSNSASQINGNLTANGNIILVNQNGVVFGAGAKVDVNSLVVSTANIDDNTFMNTTGKFTFNQPGNPSASIVNNGQITAAQAGLVGFVAPNVINNGTITATLGRIQLASGDTTTVDLYGDGLMEVAVSPAVASQLVSNTGTIQAGGGKIQLSAAAGAAIVNSLITNTGTLQAQTVSAQNGEIIIASAGSQVGWGHQNRTGTSTVQIAGTVDASGYNAGETGGDITITADNVDVLSGSTINASGDAGGGYIKIGGDSHGAGTTPTALTTIVDNGANIYADAIASGNGGNVAVWSDGYTQFAGTIYARGGSQSGNGGYVETSGHELLSLTDANGNNGVVYASAPNGTGGTWLLDPADVTINGSADTGMQGAPTYTPTGGVAESNILNTEIDAALNAGTNVTITTGGDSASGTGGGSITVASAISATTGTGGVTGNLTLSAYSDIIVNAAITLGGTGVTGGNLILDADNHANGAGAIAVNASISTNGGNITMGGNESNPANIVAGTGYAVGDAANTAGIYFYGAAYSNETINAGGGNIIMNGQGYAGTNNDYGIYVLASGGGAQTSGNGTITLNGVGGGSGDSNYGVYINGNFGGFAIISTVNGALSITGTGSGATNGFGIDFSGSNGWGAAVYSTGSGTVTLTGTGANSGANGTGFHNSGGWASDIGNSSGTGTITIASTDDISLSNVNITNTGNIILDSRISGAANGAINLADSSISSNSGNIYLGGGADATTGFAIGSSTNPAGIYSRAQINADGGNIVMHGQGYAGTNNDYGIELVTDPSNYGTIQTNGNGTINVTGTGGCSSDSNYGVYLYGYWTGTPQYISVVNGALNVTGTGSGSTNGDGIHFQTGNGGPGLRMQSTGGGAITLTGIGANSDANGSGIKIDNSWANLIGGSTTTGNITFIANTLSVLTTPTIQTTGTVTFEPYTASTAVNFANGTGGLAITQAIMDAVNAPTVTIGSTSDTGALTTGAFNWEHTLSTLNLESGGTGGSVTIGGNITKGVDDGSVANTTDGNLNVIAGSDITTGSNVVAISSSSTYGKLNTVFDSDYAGSGGAIGLGDGTHAVSISSNGGAITLGGGEANPANIVAGTGYAVGDASYVAGIYLNKATLSSSSGAIVLNGRGYTGNDADLNGIYLNNSATVQSTTGNITLDGIGGAGNVTGSYYGNSGINILNNSQITSVQGAITLNGTGGSGAIVENAAVDIDNGSTVSSTGTGVNAATITINGTGTNCLDEDCGVVIDSATAISTVDGNVSITGVAGAATNASAFNSAIQLAALTASISSTGSATITLNASGSNNGGSDLLFYRSNLAGGSSATGNIIINANTINYHGGTIQTTGTVTFAPHSASTSLGVAGGSGTLQITSGAGSVLADTTAGNIVIGASGDSGTTAINSFSTSTPISFITGNSGSNVVSGALTGTGSASFAFTGPTTLSNNITTAGGAVTFNSTTTLGATDTISTSGGNVDFASTLDGSASNYGLTVNAGNGGSATFTGEVGSNTPLGAFSVTAGGGINLNAVTASSISLDSSGGSGTIASNNSGMLDATSGTITVNSGGDIDFSNIGMETSNQAVSVTASGNAYLNAINSGTGSLTVNANNVYLYGGGLPDPGNLVAYYNFNEGSGTTATDDSGNGNTGTINGATYSGSVPFGSGYSLSFNGTNNYVDLGSLNALNPTNQSTVLWINPVSVTGYTSILSMENSAGTIYREFDINGGKLEVGLGSSANNYRTWETTATVLSTGAWSEVAVTQSGLAAPVLYVNGVAVASSQTATSGTLIQPATQDVSIGRFGAYNGGYLQASEDDVRIYNTALSAQDVANLYPGIPQWSVGTANITATNNITTNIMGTTLTAGAGKNITVTAGGSFINASPATISGSQSAGSGGNVTLMAGTDIVLPNLTMNTGGGNAILDSDTGGSGGAIALTGSTISTSGGNITLGGDEANPSNIVAGTGYATGDSSYAQGVLLNDTTLSSGAGTIVMNGQGYSNATTIDLNGIWMKGGSVVQSTSGAITLTALGGTGDTTDATYFSNAGLLLSDTNTKVSSSQGAITLNGTGGAGNTQYSAGVAIYNDAMVTSTGTGAGVSSITLNGTTLANGAYGTALYDAQITTVDGNVNIVGSGGNTNGCIP